MIDPLIGGALIGGAANLIGGAVNNIVNRSNMRQQVEQSKELMDYQWNKYQSYQAQVRSMQAAGLNPAAMYGQSATSSASPSVNIPTVVPSGFDFSNIANSALAIAQAKKAGAEEKNVGVMSDKLLTEIEANKLNNSLLKEFGRNKWALDVSLAYQNVLLAQKTNDLQDQEKAKKAWEIAKEKALSECSEFERDILKKKLDNTDLELSLSNKLLEEKAKTERSSQSVNYATAKNIGLQSDYQAIVNDIKESGKTFELENLIRKWSAENKVSDSSAEQALNLLNRYKQLNENDKNAAARYLNYMFWFIKEQMPNLPIVPFLKLGK